MRGVRPLSEQSLEAPPSWLLPKQFLPPCGGSRLRPRTSGGTVPMGIDGELENRGSTLWPSRKAAEAAGGVCPVVRPSLSLSELQDEGIDRCACDQSSVLQCPDRQGDSGCFLLGAGEKRPSGSLDFSAASRWRLRHRRRVKQVLKGTLNFSKARALLLLLSPAGAFPTPSRRRGSAPTNAPEGDGGREEDEENKENDPRRSRAWSLPVRTWMEDLSAVCEPECLHLLQSKSLCTDAYGGAVSTVRKAYEGILRAAELSHKIERALRGSGKRDLSNSGAVGILCDPSVAAFVEDLRREVDHGTNLQQVTTCGDRELRPPPRHSKRSHLHSLVLPDEAPADRRVSALGKAVHLALEIKVKGLLSYLDGASSQRAAAALQCIAGLASQKAPQAGEALLRCGCVSALLRVSASLEDARLRAMALRALSAVCRLADGRALFFAGGGASAVAAVLSGPGSSPQEKEEAAAVLARATRGPGSRALRPLLPVLVSAITGLCEESVSPRTFLMAAAALAALTSLGAPETARLVLDHGTIGAVVRQLQRHGDASRFSQDQAATALANLAGDPRAAEVIVEEGGLLLLLRYLHLPPGHPPVDGAQWGLLQKSLAALCRLCSHPRALREIVDFKGLQTVDGLLRECRRTQCPPDVSRACEELSETIRRYIRSQRDPPST